MKHFVILAGIALASMPALATPATKAPAKSGAKKALKTLNYCPMTGEKLGAKTVGATTYKGYNIAFCCSGCPGEFAHLSAKEKDAKIAEVVARQAKDQAKPNA